MFIAEREGLQLLKSPNPIRCQSAEKSMIYRHFILFVAFPDAIRCHKSGKNSCTKSCTWQIVYNYSLSNRDIACSFSSSTIFTYGFIAEKSLCPVHFIITSLGMPSCKAVTTNVRRPQWVVSNAHLGNTSSCRTLP